MFEKSGVGVHIMLFEYELKKDYESGRRAWISMSVGLVMSWYSRTDMPAEAIKKVNILYGFASLVCFAFWTEILVKLFDLVVTTIRFLLYLFAMVLRRMVFWPTALI